MNRPFALPAQKLYRIGGILLVVLVNLYFRFSFASPSKSALLVEDIDALFSRGEYTTIAGNHALIEKLPQRAQIKLISTYIKLGQYDQAAALLERTPLADTQLQTFHRILVFYHKKDRQKITDYLQGRAHADPLIRAIYMQLRAEALFAQGNYTDAAILATDSVNIDPLASAPVALQAMILTTQRERTEAQVLFERAEGLGSYRGDEYRYHKGITEFYMRDRDVMLDSFAQISPQSDRLYNVHLFSGRHRFERGEYDKAFKHRNINESLDPTAWTHQMWIGKAYIRMNQYDDALQAQQIAYDRSGTQPNPELLGDMLEPLAKTDNQEQLRIILALFPDRLGMSKRSHELYIRGLIRAGLYEQAFLRGPESVEQLSVDPEIELDSLHNYTLEAVIHLLLDNKGTEQEELRLDRLVNYQGATDKSRFLYIALWDYGMGDATSATRALQEIDPAATERDLRTIQILHHLLSNNPRDAIQRLLGFSTDQQVDIDYQRLKRKALSLLQDGANGYRQETIDQLLLLNQLTDATDDPQAAFDRRFDKWLRYMRPFYQ